ncbi:unnamed protein product, partial [Durusdinium trenchii]
IVATQIVGFQVERAVFFSPATPTEAQSAVSSPRAILTDVANGIHGTTAQHRSTANCEEPTRRNALPPAIWETRYLNSTEAYAVVLASDLILKKRSDMGHLWWSSVDDPTTLEYSANTFEF